MGDCKYFGNSDGQLECAEEPPPADGGTIDTAGAAQAETQRRVEDGDEQEAIDAAVDDGQQAKDDL